MKRILSLAAAATILAAIGLVAAWITTGNSSTNIAFASVAKALDSLRTATYDATMEMKNPLVGETNTTITTTMKMKGFFLEPSHERIEMSMSVGPAKDKGSSIMILDHSAMKGLALSPELKLATTLDLSKIKKPAGAPNLFEMVRQLVRHGNSPGATVESLGRKEIDGRVVVGFRTQNNMADMTLWADPQTARPVRIDIDYTNNAGQGVMDNFRYDVGLAPSLFSLEPPAGYTVNTMQATMPVEDDLVRLLRLIAEYNDGTFPAAIAMNSREFIKASEAIGRSEGEKLMKTPEAQKLMKKLKAQYGKDKAAFMKAWMNEWMKMASPLTQKLTQKNMQGAMFYMTLKPNNDSHYAGKGVKLGTPDRPILWYKPTGAEKYRVLYADLSVKEMTPEEIKSLPEAKVP